MTGNSEIYLIQHYKLLMVFATDSEVATFYVEKLTKRCGGYGISVWQKVKVYIQGLKNKNNSYISKPLKTQP